MCVARALWRRGSKSEFTGKCDVWVWGRALMRDMRGGAGLTGWAGCCDEQQDRWQVGGRAVAPWASWE